MKIVYCIAGTFNSGGMERVLSDKANYWSRQGHDVIIITTDQRGRTPFFELENKIKCYDLSINYDENNGKSFWNKLLHFPIKQYLHKKRLTKLLLKLKADIVVSMFNNDAAFLYKIKDGSKKALEIHFSKFKKLQYGRKGIWRMADRWRTKQEEKIVKKFDKFIVLTEEDKSYWGALPNICVIPNPRTFENNKYSPLTAPVVLAVGRYTYQKGFDRLLAIWKKIIKDAQGWQLKIVGNGEDRKTLEEQINVLNIKESVFLEPATSNIQELYLNSSVLAMTSRYEGLPMALLEAQSCGLPIVAYACQCGPKDIISDGQNGFIIENGQEEIFAKHLLELIKNPSLRASMGKDARVASESFSHKYIMQKWEDLFNLLFEEKKQQSDNPLDK